MSPPQTWPPQWLPVELINDFVTFVKMYLYKYFAAVQPWRCLHYLLAYTGCKPGRRIYSMFDEIKTKRAWQSMASATRRAVCAPRGCR